MKFLHDEANKVSYRLFIKMPGEGTKIQLINFQQIVINRHET